MYRYPESTPLSIDALRVSGWREAISELGSDGYYSSMWSCLSDAARAASEAKEFPRAKVLWVLADACSMMLKPESPSEPFKPMFILGGRRSALPEDFDQYVLEFFADAIGEIDDPWLQARLSDLLWLRLHPRRVENARIAIDAYRRIALDLDTWVRDGRECWGRALTLCRLLRGGAENRADELRDALLSAFRHSSGSDGYFPLWISQMLREHGLCRNQASSIATKLRELASLLGENGDLHCSRDHFEKASQWYSLSGEDELEAEATVAVAESWVKEARISVSNDQPSYIVGASLLESAIQAYRRIPRAFRERHNVDEQVSEIHREMNRYSELSLTQMGTIKSPQIDLSEMIQSAREGVRGKATTEALLALSNVSSGANIERVREFAEKLIREHPLQSLVAATHISADGRVVAKTPGAGLGPVGSDDYEEAVWSQMVRHFTVCLGLSVQGCIWPALEVLTAEHRFRELDFVSLARRSPIIPADREELVGKALFFGYEGDFAAAIHILVPQIEHLVRVHLKVAGEKTTTLNQKGIEQEKGLSSLMESPVPDTIFGPDLAFEIRALFCDPLGPNLRNEIAHGLINDNGSQSIFACYAWWFGLRLVFNTFWNVARRMAGDSRQADIDEPCCPNEDAEQS